MPSTILVAVLGTLALSLCQGQAPTCPADLGSSYPSSLLQVSNRKAGAYTGQDETTEFVVSSDGSISAENSALKEDLDVAFGS
eukprot:CAMPEP_0170590116 /NCGR_PEP_ID=MMETSP0224-20130122/11698_1 /TAXON_ID=285029 /ORGANISM="Togula jolla, Strain CCCM 725" /LENGTH=82 /DNA_ID=CAMNT_0010913891 /DNA_START=66 /DNA_END=311 /DNA_ORIENTATION=-